MGNTLSAPITKKVGMASGIDSRISFACSSMQGWRTEMEDRHTAILNVAPESDRKVSFFGVYDGHSGDAVARYVAKHFTTRLMESNQFKTQNYLEAMRETHISLDAEMFKVITYKHFSPGCTAVSCIITPSMRLIVANAGDSRICLSKNGKEVVISVDHKPTDKIEYARIVAAGATLREGRINGNLAFSRAFGDFEFKMNAELTPQQQAVTVDPDMYDIQLAADDEFIVLACDGIWDVMKNQEVVDFLRISIASTGSILESINLLMDKCLAPPTIAFGFGQDNMTVVVVAILHGKTFDEWLQTLRENVEIQGLTSPLSLASDGVDTNKEIIDKETCEIMTLKKDNSI